MAKMRMSRRSLSKTALEAIDRCAQPLQLGGEIRQLVTAHQRAAFRGGVISQRLADASRGIELPARKRAQRAADALRRHVTDHARELLFGVPPQVRGEIAQLVGKVADA